MPGSARSSSSPRTFGFMGSSERSNVLSGSLEFEVSGWCGLRLPGWACALVRVLGPLVFQSRLLSCSLLWRSSTAVSGCNIMLLDKQGFYLNYLADLGS